MYRTITACTAPAFFCDLTSSNTSRSFAAAADGAPSSSSHSRPILVPFYFIHEFKIMQKMSKMDGFRR
jgi:hypothetical protein